MPRYKIIPTNPHFPQWNKKKTSSSGTVYSVPYIGSLDTSTTYDMIAAAKGGDNDALMWFIEKFREWCPGLDERATIDQFGYIIGAWRTTGRDAQGVDAGESGASSS